MTIKSGFTSKCSSKVYLEVQLQLIYILSISSVDISMISLISVDVIHDSDKFNSMSTVFMQL